MEVQRRTLAVLTVLPLVMGCAGGTGGASAESAVTGVHWKVDSVTVDGTTQPAPANADAGVRFGTNGTAVGSYGCNRFGAEATFTGHRVELTNAHRTLMACEPKRMAFERALSRTLTGRPLAVGTKDGELTLTARDGDRVQLSEEKDAPLYGTRWTITALGAGGTARSLPRRAEGSAYLVFDKKPGRVTGRLGCNHVTAKATVRDGRITLGPASTTRMMCDASLMRIEKGLLRLFDSTADSTLDHRSLTLTSGNGETAEAVAGR